MVDSQNAFFFLFLTIVVHRDIVTIMIIVILHVNLYFARPHITQIHLSMLELISCACFFNFMSLKKMQLIMENREGLQHFLPWIKSWKCYLLVLLLLRFNDSIFYLLSSIYVTFPYGNMTWHKMNVRPCRVSISKVKHILNSIMPS